MEDGWGKNKQINEKQHAIENNKTKLSASWGHQNGHRTDSIIGLLTILKTLTQTIQDLMTNNIGPSNVPVPVH